MPPAVLISSTAIFMPFDTGTPQALIGPDRSWWVPSTISVAEMPSLVTLVWAIAGSCVSASAPIARPNALSVFDICSLLFPGWPVSGEGGALKTSFAVFQNLSSSSQRSGHRPRAIHRVDLASVALVHEIALQLHGRRQLLVLRRELPLDQHELLDGFDAGEIGIHRLDLAPDQILDLGRAAQAGVIGEGNVVVLRELLDVLMIDHDEAGEIGPLVADHDCIRDIGRKFELVLDLRGRDVLEIGR